MTLLMSCKLQSRSYVWTCSKAEHQARLHKAHIPKIALRTHRGQYEYKVLPSGLINAPATSQTLMQNALAPCIGMLCLVYGDDILISVRHQVSTSSP